MPKSSALLLISLTVSLGAAAADLHGSVTLVDTAAGGAGDLTDAVVFFEPDQGTKVKPLPDPATMVMQHKVLQPHVLAVTIGSTVEFPNDDPILHNVFSTTPGDEFDLGLYRQGTEKSVTFHAGGLVRVFCNVHRDMFGYILVLDTPYFTRVKADGRFDLANLPATSGDLVIWHPRTPVWREHVTATSQAPLDVTLRVVRSGIPAHFNKFGKPYSDKPDSGY